MQPYVTTSGLLAHLAPVVVCAVLVALSFLQRERQQGWRHVSPGFGYWLALVLSFGLAMLIGWVWVFVGSSRPDGENQMHFARWLSFVFGLAALWCGWRILLLERQGLRWRGDVVAWRRSGAQYQRALLGATNIASRAGGNVRVTFSNGDLLTIDISAYHASQLIAKIEDANGLSDSDEVPEH